MRFSLLLMFCRPLLVKLRFVFAKGFGTAFQLSALIEELTWQAREPSLRP
jgi:hypothetical protein